MQNQANKYLFIFGQVVGNVYLCARLRKKWSPMNAVIAWGLVV